MHMSFCVGMPVPFVLKIGQCRLLCRLGPKKGSRDLRIVHAATYLQLFVLAFGSLKLIWVCLHILHSLCFAKIQTSWSFTWSEQT